MLPNERFNLRKALTSILIWGIAATIVAGIYLLVTSDTAAEKFKKECIRQARADSSKELKIENYKFNPCNDILKKDKDG